MAAATPVNRLTPFRIFFVRVLITHQNTEVPARVSIGISSTPAVGRFTIIGCPPECRRLVKTGGR
jgi:hypothetical protein